jgi:benzoate-CoA ligase
VPSIIQAGPQDIFKVVHRYRPTIFFGVPTLYAGMLALPDADKRFDFSSVRLCVSSGEALPADLLRHWREKFHIEVLDAIGSTEVLHIFISNRSGESKPGSTGKVAPGCEARRLNEQGQLVKPGEMGTLLIRAESTMAYDWNQHDKTKPTLCGYWIRTGDKYYRDEEGSFWYCGRSDDMLKVGGQWVSPIEVESALIAHPTVLEAAVVGASDADTLSKPKAYVVLKPGYEPSEVLTNELKTFIKERLARLSTHAGLCFCPNYPKRQLARFNASNYEGQISEEGRKEQELWLKHS